MSIKKVLYLKSWISFSWITLIDRMFQSRFQSVPGPINVGAVVNLDLVTDSDCVEIGLLTTQHSGGGGGWIGHAAIRGWDLERGKIRIQLTLMWCYAVQNSILQKQRHSDLRRLNIDSTLPLRSMSYRRLSESYSGYRLRQYETALQYNVVSHWLSPYLKWSPSVLMTRVGFHLHYYLSLADFVGTPVW